MDVKSHWERVYRSSGPTEVSWYQPEASASLELIRRAAPDPGTPIIDVGGGASTLVDGLLATGYRDITVLDVAGEALRHSRARLGYLAEQVSWVESDALGADFPEARWGLWHERAVFHFLTHPENRARYVAQIRRALRPGGHLIMAAFHLDGPERCSGLDVMRHDCESLHAEVGADFTLLDKVREQHRTPTGRLQSFVYCMYRREG